MIERFSGMTNFKKTAPAGKIITSPENKNKVMIVPQKVNPNYTEQDFANDVEDFGGEKSIGVRIFVDGDIVEDYESVFDMERVRELYEDSYIKNYEIDKDSFKMYAQILSPIVRPKQAERIFMGMDVGDGSGDTEITIFSEFHATKEADTIYRYVYNVTLFQLTDDEQKEVLEFLITHLNAEMTAIDIGSGTGKAIYNELAKKYSKNLYAYYGNEKIQVAYEIDENGNPFMEKGEFVYKEEFAAEFSIKRLQQLFYNKRFILPYCPKLDKQFDNVTAAHLSNRVVYKCASKKDHLLDSFKTFSIAQWVNEFSNLKKPENMNKQEIAFC